MWDVAARNERNEIRVPVGVAEIVSALELERGGRYVAAGASFPFVKSISWARFGWVESRGTILER